MITLLSDLTGEDDLREASYVGPPVPIVARVTEPPVAITGRPAQRDEVQRVEL
jgi:hypothetical protein